MEQQFSEGRLQSHIDQLSDKGGYEQRNPRISAPSLDKGDFDHCA
jgi:hypothetical protein